MAEPITQTRLRELAAVHPEQGRVLSVFLNLDPAQFATPAARSSAITSVMTEAAHKVEEADGLSHDERMALRDDVERVRDVLARLGRRGQRHARASPSTPAAAEDLLEVVRLRRPVDNRSCSTARRSSSRSCCRAPTSTGSCCSSNRRAARLFVGPGDELEETDRIVDDVHSQHDQGGWSQLNYQRSVEKEVHDHLVHAAEVAFELYKQRGLDRVLIGAPEELLGELKSKLHPYLRERIAGKLQVDVENASLDDVRAARARRDRRRTCGAASARRSTGSCEGVGRGGRGAAGLAARARRAQPGARGDAADRRELPRRGRVDVEAGLLLPRGRRRRPAGGGHRRAGDREGDRAVGAARSSCATTTISGRSAGSARCCASDARRRARHRDHGRAAWPATSRGAGHEVRAWNRSRDKRRRARRGRRRLARGGGRRAPTVVITMLADGTVVEAVMDGVALTGDQVWWQASTVGVAADGAPRSGWPARRRSSTGRCWARASRPRRAS